jgi:tRNA threonylcarbamoyladenosine biosynthesis protein TsaE
VHSYRCPDKLSLHHADLYRLDRTADVDDLALHELAAFGGIVLIEWGDVAAASFGDHVEVRLFRLDETEADDAGTDDAESGRADPADQGAPDDPFGLDGARTIEVAATGRSWAGRWDRVVDALEEFRC